MNRYDLMVNGRYVDTIKANDIEQADTIAHQLHPYMTDDDYELVDGGFEQRLDWEKFGDTYYLKVELDYLRKQTPIDTRKDNKRYVCNRLQDIKDLRG